MKEGLSGRIASTFIKSKLTILLMVAIMVAGAYSTYLIPREEEPQISIPIADIFIAYPGASPTEVETKVAAPLEKVVSNVKGVEHVYSSSMNEQTMLTVQFYVGEDVERSLVKLYSEIMKNMDKMPQGISMPLIKTRSIDDVPVLGLTLWSEKYSDYELRKLSEVLANEIKKVRDVSDIKIIGGRSQEVRITPDKDKMEGSRVDILSIARQIQASNSQQSSGTLLKTDTAFSVVSGSFLASAEEVGNIIVGANGQFPVYLKQIANVEDAASTPSQYVYFGYGKGAADSLSKHPSEYQGITLSIAKKAGADAMHLSDEIITKVNSLKKELIPDDVHIDITRNYGETASLKVSELLLHLFITIVIVTLFVMLAMGWRGGLVVFLSVPVTFALTLFVYYFLGYTLNRITLFALVFITGIVVDDSIIIAENMHRHFKMRKLPFYQAAIYAINEVGNPTILATFTVVAAILPMAFVTGMMGPYMSPMPIGASIAMMFSLIVALTLTPYLGYVFLKHISKKEKKDSSTQLEESPMYKLYRATINPLLESRKYRWIFMVGTIIVLIGSMMLFYTKSVALKMLPFDNKNEFQVVVDMPEGTTLERTAAVTREVAQHVGSQPLVKNYQNYIGTAGPISFNGLVRHYDLRKGDNVADIQVNLIDKSERSLQSHDIAKSMRPSIQAIAQKYNANIKIVEVPPGPPVLSTVVAEVYGPEYSQQIEIARQVKTLFASTEGMADIDWMVEDNQPEYFFDIDKEKALRSGIAPAQIVSTLNAGLSGQTLGKLNRPENFSPIPIRLQLADSDKSNLEDLKGLKVMSQNGNRLPVGDFVTISNKIKDKSIFRKDQKRVVYVVADMAGKLESPFYAMTKVSEKLKNIKLPDGYTLKEEYSQQPKSESNFSLKWDGEWQITYDVFRDLGIAFVVAIVVIYMLIVGWFQNFRAPVIMLAPIPLSLIGIILGHWILGAYFTATSMIGFIALAGVMVRNSVLLIDFINIRLNEGISLKQSIIESGAVRTTPILLTAGSVALGAIIILFDPIFQGLAISLIGGTVTSTFLTLVVVPLLYYRMVRNKNQ